MSSYIFKSAYRIFCNTSICWSTMRAMTFNSKINTNCFHIYLPLQYNAMCCLSGFELQDFEESLL